MSLATCAAELLESGVMEKGAVPRRTSNFGPYWNPTVPPRITSILAAWAAVLKAWAMPPVTAATPLITPSDATVLEEIWEIRARGLILTELIWPTRFQE